MKTLNLRKLLAALSLTAGTFISQAPMALDIHLNGFKTTEGAVLGIFYRSQADFNQGQNGLQPFTLDVTAAQQTSTGELIHTVTDLPEGALMFTVFHDENGNGTLDTNFMGLPIEPYGFSNNARGNFGPPHFDEAKFDSVATDSLYINLK